MGFLPTQTLSFGPISFLNWIQVKKGVQLRAPMLGPDGLATGIGPYATSAWQDGTNDLYNGENITLTMPYMTDIWAQVHRDRGRRENIFAGTLFEPGQILWANSEGIESIVLFLNEVPANVSESFGNPPIIYAGKFQFVYEDCYGPLHFINAKRQRVWPEAAGSTGINLVQKPDCVVSVYTSYTEMSKGVSCDINGTPCSPIEGIMKTPLGDQWF